MLCTSFWLHDQTAPYRPVHMKHPCTIWSAASLDNWLWLKDLLICLNEELKNSNLDPRHKDLGWRLIRKRNHNCFKSNKYEKRKKLTLNVLKNQIRKSLDKKYDFKKIMIAYEPIWSIGTGLVPSVNEIKEVHSFVKSFINSPILYGGSLNNKNCDEIFNIHEVDGGLIGGASLEPDSFISIITFSCIVFISSLISVIFLILILLVSASFDEILF